jgi:hypothetical protein
VSTISIWIADDANCARSVEYSLADCGRDHGRTSVRLPYWRSPSVVALQGRNA